MPHNLPASPARSRLDTPNSIDDPTMRVKWRFKRLLQMVNHQPRPLRCHPYDDDFIRTMWPLILRENRGVRSEELAAEFPGPFYALSIYAGVYSDKKLWVESRILARQTDEEIAVRLGTTAEAIRLYEAIFFNVRPHLDCEDWINISVLRPARSEHREFGYAVLYNAYYGGVAALELLLNSAVGRNWPCADYPETEDQVKEYLEDSALSQLARMAVLAANSGDICKTNVDKLLRAYRGLKASTKVDCKATKSRQCVKDNPSVTGESDIGSDGDEQQMNDTDGGEEARLRRKKKFADLDAVVNSAVGNYGKANSSESEVHVNEQGAR